MVKYMLLNKIRMNIPAELKNLNYWVVHKNKIPYEAKTGKPAKSNDSSTWTDFSTAMLAARSDAFDGVGFMFKAPYIGVDLDKSLDLTIPKKLNSYTEYSPSGNGIHVICKGEIPRSLKKPGLEIYNGFRYFTVTGNRINQFPKAVLECTKPLSEFFNVEDKATKADNWIADALKGMKKGTIHNTTMQILGKLHRAKCSQGDMDALLWPSLEKIGGDRAAFEERLTSVMRYTNGNTVEISQNQSSSLLDFMNTIDNIKYIVPGYFADNTINIIAGLQASYKSWILLDLGIALASGTLWLNRYPTARRRVMVIDQERPKLEIQRRIRAITTAKNINLEDLENYFIPRVGTTIRLNQDKSYEAFTRLIEKERPEVILIDSLKAFQSGNINDNQVMQDVFERFKALRNKFGVTFVILHHENKGAYLRNREGNEVTAENIAGASCINEVPEGLFVSVNGSNSSVLHHVKNSYGVKCGPTVIFVKDLDKERKKIIVEAV